jgi:hypothetical protein
VYNARRELRYGLVFYRNQKVSSYNEKDIPFSEHLLIAKAGSRAEFEPLLKGRQVARIGQFPAQHVEYFLVSAVPRQSTEQTQAAVSATHPQAAPPPLQH